MNIKTLLNELKTQLERLYGNSLKDMMLYGSWARDEATPESDIDILIVLEGQIHPGEEIDRMIDIITELNMKYDALISIYPISEHDFVTVNSPLLMNVRKEGIPA